MADPKLGILSEHAPVQAIYIGATVKADEAKPENYVVHHGQLLFVKAQNSSNTPEVYNAYGNNMVPFGVAHDAVLDGKLAMENPESVAIVSVIVSGCVTMLAAGSESAKVGDTLYVNRTGPTTEYDMGGTSYTAPSYNTSARGVPDSGTRIGRVVEVYPAQYGVLRVALDIAVPSTKSVVDFAAGEKTANVTMAPQHPVYACLKNRQGQWNEGHPVFMHDNHHTTVFPVSTMPIVGLAADTAADDDDENTNAVATQIAGAGSCTLTLKTPGTYIPVGAVINCSGSSAGGTITMRVLARPGNTEYYVLIAHNYSSVNPGAHLAEPVLATVTEPDIPVAVQASFKAAVPAKKAKTSKGSKTTKLR
ncbi:hypothetical protein [Nereida ignava]|uniref:hypothetical protein n=1 Tax=Nereida ignava TaxID=282199 RepID=UPI0030FC87FB